MNIKELTKKFSEEDKNWTLEGVRNWIVAKKGISAIHASYGISKVLMDMEIGKIKVESHSGPEGFDNLVLNVARDQMKKEAKDGIIEMEKMLNGQIKEIRGGYFRKLGKALFGRL